MKTKMILTSLLLVVGMSAMAQGGPRGNRGGRGGFNMDQVVDTAVINKLDLQPEVVAQVLELQASKADAIKEQMEKLGKRGNNRNKEQREAMQKEREEFNAAYRAELRQILGDETYITYLEKMLDNRGMMGMPRMNMNGQGFGQGGFPGGEGGFPGGGGFGGGFGGGGFGPM